MTTAPAAIPAARKPPAVLIVEDEPNLRDLLLDVIPDMGFPAAAVRSAEDAIRAFAQNPTAADIVVLDLQLPLMSGLELLDRLRAEQRGDIQVIILTGFGDLDAARRAIHHDVVEFLTKPCDLGDIERALDRARRRLVPVAPTPPLGPSDPVGSTPLTLAESEYQQIREALARHGGNRTAAAQDLGVSRRTLHYRLAHYRRTGRPLD